MDFSIKLGETSVGYAEILRAPPDVLFYYKGFCVGKLSHQAKWLTSIMPGGFETSEEHIRRKRPKCGGTRTRSFTMIMRRRTTCLK